MAIRWEDTTPKSEVSLLNRDRDSMIEAAMGWFCSDEPLTGMELEKLEKYCIPFPEAVSGLEILGRHRQSEHTLINLQNLGRFFVD